MDIPTDPERARERAETRQEILRSVEAFIEIDKRIARLSRTLDVTLRSEEDLQRILDRTAPGFVDAPTLPGRGVGVAPDRTWVEHEELRGLLVVRLDLLRHTLAERGLEATRDIVEMAETELTRHGFAPGADGCVFQRRLASDAG